MKLRFTSLLIFIFFSINLKADIIPEDCHHVNLCVKITNVDSFPETVFINRIAWEGTNCNNYFISSTDCLKGSYWFQNIYATNQSTLSGISLQEFEPNSNNSAISNIKINSEGSYYHDTIPYSQIFEYYRVMGFTELNVVLHKYKTIINFNNGNQDSVINYEYQGDSTLLSQEIILSINNYQVSNSTLFPNPATDELNISLNNYKQQQVNVTIFTSNGKSIRNVKFCNNSYSIPLNNIEQGIYFVNIKYGDIIETKKVIINSKR